MGGIMSGFGTELGITNLIILVGLMIKFWIIPVLQAKKKGDNPRNLGTGFYGKPIMNPIEKPGKSEKCIAHGEALVKLKVMIDNLKEELQRDISEIKEHCTRTTNKLFDKLEQKSDK